MTWTEREACVRNALGVVSLRRGSRVLWVHLDDHWWLFVPAGRYELGVRPTEIAAIQSVPNELPGYRLLEPHAVTFAADVLLRAVPVLVDEVDVDLERDRLTEDEGEPDILYACADELQHVEQRCPDGVCSSDEWEAAIRLLGVDVPYLLDGAAPTQEALDRVLPEMRDGDAWSWSLPHVCRDGDQWTCRGGPGTSWPFQHPSEWLLTVPSLVVAGWGDTGSCVVRPRRRVTR